MMTLKYKEHVYLIRKYIKIKQLSHDNLIAIINKFESMGDGFSKP